MGVGKSVVAQRLAELLSLPLIDLDAHIEKEKGKSIFHIFKEEGEATFREYEKEAILLLLERDNCIVALGGGSINHNKLDARIRSKAFLIYLKASPEFLSARLKSEKKKRPVIAHLADQELDAFIESHLQEREKGYLNAQISIDVEGKSLDEIANYLKDYFDLL